ncbi:MAG: hypothetical protein ABIQ35_14650, partial [Verrucomicrobiota bacterium]
STSGIELMVWTLAGENCFDNLDAVEIGVPKGSSENSTAFQRRISICNVTSPEGTAEMPPCPT